MNSFSQSNAPGMKRGTWRWVTVLLIVLVGTGLNIGSLAVSLPTGDESGYLLDGANLAEHGTVLAIGSGPLPSLINGLLDLPFRGDHLRLGLVSTIRRFHTYGLVLLAVWWAARRIGGETAGWLGLLLAAVGRPVSVALDNSADALYMTLSALAFALGVGMLLDWIREEEQPRGWVRRGVAFGAFLGVAALAHLDGVALGVLVFACTLTFALVGRCSRGKRRSLVSAGLLGLGGFALPVLGWIVISSLLRGSWETQILQRSYLAFEQGHNFLYSGRFEVPPPVTADQLYGTAAANHYSVLTALAHNPRAFLARVPLVLANAVRMFENSYGIVAGLLILLLAVAGAVYLGTVAPILLGFSLLWFIPLLGYLFASYRPGFFSMVYPEVLALLSAGMAALLGEFRSLWPKAALRPSLFTSILLLLLAVGGNLEYGGEQALGWLRTRRTNPDLQWVGALSQNIPRGSCIISYDTSDAIYANLLPNSDWMTYFETHSPSDLSEFMQTQNCHYVEVDSDLTTYAPGYAKLVEGSLVLKFSSADGTRRVYSDRP